MSIVRIRDSQGELAAFSDSSSDEDGSGRDVRWGRYAALASRRSRCSSVRSRQNVEILAKTREWGQIDESSSDDETPGGQDRQERYARMFQEMEADAKGAERGESPKQERRGSRWLCFTCCLNCLLQNTINVSLGVLLFEHRNMAVACFLAPPAVFLAALDLCLAGTDRSIVRTRCRLRREGSALRRVLLEAFVFVVLGCLHGYCILQAYRHWAGIDSEGSFLTDLEDLDASRRLWKGKRYDSHRLLWSAPTAVCLACALTLGSVAFPGDLFWYAVLAYAVFSATASVETFDYATSHQVRTWRGMVFDGRRWTESGAQSRRFEHFHRAARGCEVVGRVLVLASIAATIPDYPLCAVSLLVADYAVCLMALYLNSGLTMEVLVVSIAFALADIVRYVDEPGFALPARRVSCALDVARALETFVAMAVCGAAAVGFGGPCVPAVPCAALLFVLLVLVQAVRLVLGRLLRRQGRCGDVFTAVLDADLEAMEQSLSFEGGCTADTTICDSTRRTALHLAAGAGRLECAQFLLKHGAKRNALDSKLENPLHIAVRRRDVCMAEALVREGGGSGWESGGRACPRQAYQMIRQMNCRGETPQDLLKKKGPPRLAELLMDTATEAVEAELAARVVARSDSSGTCMSRGATSHSSAPSLVHSVSSSVMNNLFGTIVGGEHFNVQVGPREKVLRAELAAFVFFRGMGEQLQRLHLYFRRSRRRHTSARVHVSDLRNVATLGAGGFGKVLKVEDVRSGELYALKLQCKNKTTKQAVREVQALSAFSQHPYVVGLIQIFRTSAFYGILMEFCDKDLNKRILEQESAMGRVEGLPPAIAARYTACVMFALEYLHSNSIVFRDLKPENVLIAAKDDLARLTDFGLARTVTKQVNEDGDLVGPAMSLAAGTLGFMSSEAFDGSPDGEDGQPSEGWFAARDWYSLGCCLLLMMLGEGGGRKVYAGKRHVLLPAPGNDILELLLKALDEETLSEEAFDLVSSLTAAKVTERADAGACRASPFLREAIAELEPPPLEPVRVDF